MDFKEVKRSFKDPKEIRRTITKVLSRQNLTNHNIFVSNVHD